MNPPQVSELQHEILRILWAQVEARASEVHEGLSAARDLAPTTVSTLLTRMEKKGLVAHRTEGRQFVYRALVSEREIRQSMVTDLAERVFEGDLAAMVSDLLGGTNVSAEELETIRGLLDRKQEELEGPHGN